MVQRLSGGADTFGAAGPGGGVVLLPGPGPLRASDVAQPRDGKSCIFCVENDPVGDAYMIAPQGAGLRLPVFYVAPAPAARFATFPGCHSIAHVAMRHRNLALVLVAASALSGAVATWALTARQEIKTDTSPLAAVRNETVVYQQPRRPPPNLEQELSEHPYTEQIEAADELDEDDNIPSNFVRTVQTLRFVSPDPTSGVGKVTAAAPEATRETLGSFVALRPKEDAGVSGEKGSILPRKRDGSVMDEVDDYLWEVYQRVPTKKDGSGDFTWKDPAAAEHVGLSLQDYVIGGMDPQFRQHGSKFWSAEGLHFNRSFDAISCCQPVVITRVTA